MSPDKLVLEPLTNSYTDLVQSLINVGYTLGVDLFVANWDWRLPVAKQDTTRDGQLTRRRHEHHRLDLRDRDLDYLGYWLDQARTAWTALGNAALPAVDLITQQYTGGLVARSYIQSVAYWRDLRNEDPPTDQQPHPSRRPESGSYQHLQFSRKRLSQKASARVLARVINAAYEKVLAVSTVQNPDGTTITKAMLDSQGSNAMEFFVGKYIQSLEDLVGTYAFLDSDGDGDFEVADTANSGHENKLLLDLNAGADSNAFIDGCSARRTSFTVTRWIRTTESRSRPRPQFSLGLDQRDSAFDKYFGFLPAAGQQWYAESESNSSGNRSDGTGARFPRRRCSSPIPPGRAPTSSNLSRSPAPTRAPP
jgi:hypothetical protein